MQFNGHKISKVKINIIANYAGSGWAVLMNLAFVPLYIKFLGIESYGLIGFFASLQIVLQLLDLGLSMTFSREIARLSAFPDSAHTMRNLLRTFEIIYWIIALIGGILFLISAPFFTAHWLKPGSLSHNTVEYAIMLMGFGIVLKWPNRIYAGGLTGLQKQVLSNNIEIIFSTLRGGGAVLILWLISPTIIAFFLWQALMNSCQTIVFAIFLKKVLPVAQEKTVFNKLLLHGVWKFAAGMSGISVLSVVMTQLDKIILSKMLSLELFGYYTLAGTVVSGIYALSGPVQSAVFPRFAQLIAEKKETVIKELYHQISQLMSVIIMPAGIIVCLFSYETLFLWTQNKNIASQTYMILSVLILGTLLNGLLQIPYIIQIAYGWTKLALYYNFISVVVLVPLLIVLTKYFASIGAACAWLILNGCGILIVIQLIHRKILVGEKIKWYFDDVGKPFISAVIVALVWKILLPHNMPIGLSFIYLSAAFITTLAATAYATIATRTWMKEAFSRIRVTHG